ncbi:type II CRISPR RNA-guided endonuclease Cas9 [Xylanibacter caecicola]|uniref:type II CRISPR RNA-guided endonuclease Cas9 n=1 Tax=Xylanibacter caecicola TaxID=2736294 RepID=UPI0025891B80|nr:type II CRISPR RNA-guided endonuclease Cas9 [Xylanibacter caecicola]
MKKILGLDLGTNSIGWALVNCDINAEGNERLTGIIDAGSRIIPMDASVLGDFSKGNTVSQTRDRTKYRGMRRMVERHLLRRGRMHRVLDILGFLPKHYSASLDRYGKFKDGVECKIAWKKDDWGLYTFLFRNSYEEMLNEFRQYHPEWLANGAKIPYDWTIYYLRKKALKKALSKEELAWILLNFNQKRGYYQLRGEEEEKEENDKKSVEYYALTVTGVEETEEYKGKDRWYNIHLENGMVYRRTFSVAPDWIGKTKEFIVTTDLDTDGNPKKDKDGNLKRSFRLPKENDWTLIKKKTESDIETSGKTVGEYIYDALLSNPRQKIKGKLVRTVERRFYKNELIAILNNQKKFIKELTDGQLYEDCIKELYHTNDSYRMSIANRGFTYLFVDNIIFYQRPLKSKKSLIANCPYEKNAYKDKETDEQKTAPIKCIAKSHPLFQEFRLWQFVQNLKIYERQKEVNGKLLIDVDVTSEFLNSEDDIVLLFDFLNCRENISQDALFATYFKIKKPRGKDVKYPYRWNYVEDKTYPCNETHAKILARLKKSGVDDAFPIKDKEEHLWHILYSVSDKQELKTAIERFAEKNGLGEQFVTEFIKFPPFDKEYGSYSAKAIKKLLPLMRVGKYWSEENISADTKERILKIIAGECDETISNRVREKVMSLDDITDFRGLPLWLACYIVYNRHSEATNVDKWTCPADIDKYLNEFKQHSLHNPIVEQVVMETLRTVRDIWKKHDRIDEIHIELGREMKNPKDKRARMAKQAIDNENTNLRIKALLAEFMNPDYEIENVRPYSQSQQEILRIYEETALANADDVTDDKIDIINRLSQSDVKKMPSHSEILKYKSWLEQRYLSPYTGKSIPLSRLFTEDYEIEHIIPQSRYFDDSFSNKIICEAEVNKLKDKMLGYEFIKAHHGEKVQLSQGGEVTILSVSEYEELVHDCYKHNKPKLKKLLMDDIPDDFIKRQLNDTRYISKMVKSLLSNIVREEGEIEAISKNIVVCNGAVTDRLKKDWGMNDVWNRIILPRFRRLNGLTATSKFTSISVNGHEIPDMPFEFQKGFNKKRIDHRHHAMDAIVIACATRNHVNLLNNESAMSKNKSNRYALSKKLRNYLEVDIERNGQIKHLEVAKDFIKPWPTFTADAEKALRSIVISFKQNQRIINKTSNHYQIIKDSRKITAVQVKGDSWAIRKAMHKETVYGEVNLRRIKPVPLKEALANIKSIVDKGLKSKLKELVTLQYNIKQIKAYFENNKEVWSDVDLKKIPVYYFTKDTKDRFFATRFNNDLITIFAEVTTVSKAKDIIEKITDTGIQKILWRHLEYNGNDPVKAFSADGIEEMNRNIRVLNNGKNHQPIFRVRLYEKADKFAIGKKGNKSKKFVEAAKGTNLFFAIYENGDKRTYATVPLNVVIDRQKKGLPSAPEDVNGTQPKFVLSPNDLVYVPTPNELDHGIVSMPLNKERIYKMVSSNKFQCFFVKSSVATTIIDKYEFSPLNKMERAITGEMIKEICIPLKIDRLGHITLKETP